MEEFEHMAISQSIQSTQNTGQCLDIFHNSKTLLP